MSNPKPAGPHSCGHAEYVWLSPCDTACCGAHCEEYQWEAVRGTLRSGLKQSSNPNGGGDPGTTLTIAPEGVPDTTMAEEPFPASDPRAASQQVALTADGLLRIGGESGTRCLSAAAPFNYSVFGRKLAGRQEEGGGDSWAVLFINWASKPQSVVCDAGCMAQMGWSSLEAEGSGSILRVRDLWTHTDNGTATAASGLSFTVKGGGASVLVKLTAAATGSSKANRAERPSEPPRAQAHEEERGADRYESSVGAITIGGDLGTANMTATQAQAHCSSLLDCVGFTFSCAKPGANCTTVGKTDVYKILFKSISSGNTDRAWRTDLKLPSAVAVAIDSSLAASHAASPLVLGCHSDSGYT